MKVHQKVDATALEVVLQPVDNDPLPNIDELDISQIGLVFADGLIDPLVVANAVEEVLGSRLRVLTDVIWRCSLDLEDVRHDDTLVIADGFDEDRLEAFLEATFLDPATTRFGGVGSIENGNHSFFILEPFEHISDSCLRSGSPESFALGVAGIEELGRRAGGVAAPILPDVECFSIDRQPLEISHD